MYNIYIYTDCTTNIYKYIIYYIYIIIYISNMILEETPHHHHRLVQCRWTGFIPTLALMELLRAWATNTSDWFSILRRFGYFLSLQRKKLQWVKEKSMETTIQNKLYKLWSAINEILSTKSLDLWNRSCFHQWNNLSVIFVWFSWWWIQRIYKLC